MKGLERTGGVSASKIIKQVNGCGNEVMQVAKVKAPELQVTFGRQSPGNSWRAYVYVPSSFKCGKPLATIFSYGGGSFIADRIVETTQFVPPAKKEGFAVVSPEGINKNWADGRGTAEAAIAGVDDVLFTEQMIDSFSSSHLCRFLCFT